MQNPRRWATKYAVVQQRFFAFHYKDWLELKKKPNSILLHLDSFFKQFTLFSSFHSGIQASPFFCVLN